MCDHVLEICVLSNAPCGAALLCSKCNTYFCAVCDGHVPVFAKHCAKGLMRSHFSHYAADAQASGCCGGTEESSLHLRAKLYLQQKILSRQGAFLIVQENLCARGERDGWRGHFITRRIDIPVGTRVVLEPRLNETRPDILVTFPDGKSIVFEIKNKSWTHKDRPCEWWEFDAEKVLDGKLSCIRYRNPEFARKKCASCEAYFKRRDDFRRQTQIEEQKLLEEVALATRNAEVEDYRKQKEEEEFSQIMRVEDEEQRRLQRIALNEKLKAEQAERAEREAAERAEASKRIVRSAAEVRCARAQALLEVVPTLNVEKLRQLARRMYLPATGPKDDLQKRLVDYAYRLLEHNSV